MRYLAIPILLVCGVIRADDPAPGAAVLIELDDGRVVRGTFDAASDEFRVVITSAEPGIRMRSEFPAERVRTIRPTSGPLPSLGLIRVEPPIVRRTRFGHRETRPRVRSLVVEARIANLDRDAEPDGLVVNVVPLDEWGRVVPVDGWVSAELFVRRYRTDRELPWRERERPFDAVERWSERLDARSVGPDGAYVKLPFRRLHPERDLGVAPLGLLRVRLVVRGEGSFEAEDGNVRLRTRSRFRDELELFTGSRRIDGR